MGSQWGARVNIPVDWAARKALNKRALEIHSKVNPLTCQLVYNPNLFNFWHICTTEFKVLPDNLRRVNGVSNKKYVHYSVKCH